MKAISLHQPYASLLAYGVKEFETRRFPAPECYVEPKESTKEKVLAIHATGKTNFLFEPDTDYDMKRFAGLTYSSLLSKAQHCYPKLRGVHWKVTDFGAIVGIGFIRGVMQILDVKVLKDHVKIRGIVLYDNKPILYNISLEEYSMGDWSVGMYAWKVDAWSFPYSYAIRCSGQQRFWTVPDDVREKLKPYVK